MFRDTGISRAFLAGFLEAEAHFGITLNNRSTSWTCSMSVSVRDDDAQLLADCAATFGIGRLDRRRRRTHSQPQARWVVLRKADTARLADLLAECQLIGRKRHAIELWSQAVRLWSARRYGNTPETFRSLARLSGEMKRINRYRTDVRYPEVPLIEAGYLAGFITGEGCLTFCNGRPRLSVHLRADDAPLVDAFARDTRLGSVYRHGPVANSAPSVSWHVHLPCEMLALVELLDGIGVRGRKHTQYRAWRPAAVEVGRAFSDSRKPDRAVLDAARATLRAVSRYPGETHP